MIRKIIGLIFAYIAIAQSLSVIWYKFCRRNRKKIEPFECTNINCLKGPTCSYNIFFNADDN